jgi:NAD(P)-dependent dehydrogenase (short-subunit alcohol dehydrogenase family)
MNHPAIAPGRTAVITGGASGIGFAAARRFFNAGMNVVIADVKIPQGQEAVSTEWAPLVAAHSKEAGQYDVLGYVLDVADHDAVEALRTYVYETYGDVAVLMNNAGVGGGGSAIERLDDWRRVLGINLMGVLHGVQAFAPAMIAAGKPGLIINTGSKQGITSPPGDTAYNVSKAGIKALTEGLQHTLRNTPDCQVSAHLLVPGFTFTGLTRGATEKPAGAWTADQVVDFMLDGIERGDFYILCPDNDVTREMDNARMEWAMGDLINNRPPLSRWHEDHKEAFAAFLAAQLGHGSP